jgi:formate/nitrite transporter FocA (FNT family)
MGSMPEPGTDAHSPREIAGRINDYAVAKAKLPLLQLALLGMLAGAFIGFGAIMLTLVTSDGSLGYAASRLLGGLAFSLGLILVSVAGAEAKIALPPDLVGGSVLVALVYYLIYLKGSPARRR